MNKLPQAKNTDIIQQELDGDLLIYCLEDSQAFCLNETSAAVWRHCDGETSFETLKSRVKDLTDDIILLALNDFQKRNLLQDNFEPEFLNEKINRREVLRKYGSAAITLPVIFSIVAPIAAQTQSCIRSGNSFTIPSTDTNDCFTPTNLSRCCDRAIRSVSFTPPNTVTCTCGLTVLPP